MPVFRLVCFLLAPRSFIQQKAKQIQVRCHIESYHPLVLMQFPSQLNDHRTKSQIRLAMRCLSNLDFLVSYEQEVLDELRILKNRSIDDR